MIVSDPREHYTDANGTRLAWFEWGERDAGRPTILMIHATGFHARCWDQTVARLGEFNIIAVDMRGHGRSGKEGPLSWDTFGRDLEALITTENWRGLIGVGHSMGGHAVVQAAAALPDRFTELVLVDPVILPPEAYARFQPSSAEAHPVSRRRNHFENAGALRRQLEGRGGFAAWQSEALDDYCEHGLLPDPDGDGFVLACPPRVEATIYTGSAGTDIFDAVRSVKCPVTVLRAEARPLEAGSMDFSKSPTWPALAGEFPNAEDVYLPSLTHFIPMQAPELVAEYVERAAARSGAR